MQPSQPPPLIFESLLPYLSLLLLFSLIRHSSFHLLVLLPLRSVPSFFSFSFSYSSSHYIYVPLWLALIRSAGSYSTHLIPSSFLPLITITSTLLTLPCHELPYPVLSLPFPSWCPLPSPPFSSFLANSRCCGSPPSMRASRFYQGARATSMRDTTHSSSITPSFLWSVSLSLSLHTPHPPLPYPTLPFLPTHTHQVLCVLGVIVIFVRSKPCFSTLCTSCSLLSLQQRLNLCWCQSKIVRVSHI